MRDKELRKAISEMAEELGFEPVILDDQDYDGSIIGMTYDGRLVYDYWSMVDELWKEDGGTRDEAIEWIEYNTMRAIPYMGEHAPIVLWYDRDYITSMYGRD